MLTKFNSDRVDRIVNERLIEAGKDCLKAAAISAVQGTVSLVFQNYLGSAWGGVAAAAGCGAVWAWLDRKNLGAHAGALFTLPIAQFILSPTALIQPAKYPLLIVLNAGMGLVAGGTCAVMSKSCMGQAIIHELEQDGIQPRT
jgi:hypothetical protein